MLKQPISLSVCEHFVNSSQLHFYAGPHVLSTRYVPCCRPESDGSYSVRFLDLDWCGPETQAKYPDFMSRYIDWPDDALEGTPILEKHDLEMAELMFRPNDKSVQDQRRRKRQAPLSMAFNSAVRMHHRGFLAKLCGSRLLQARQGCCRF